MSVIFIAQMSYSQIFSWGIKGGVNSSKVSFDDFSIDQPPKITVDPNHYNDIANIIADNALTDDQKAEQLANPNFYNISAPSITFTPSSYDMGYHFGAFARVKLLGIFVQPELIFSQTKTTLNIKEQNKEDLAASFLESTSQITYTNFDIPVMVGVKLGPLRLNAGPVASFKLGNNSDESATDEINGMVNDFTEVTKKATFGGQAGVGLDILGKVTLDVRYEFPLSKLGDSVKLGDYTYNTDQRASQFLASIGIMF